jgi:hypothetical protein
MDANGVQTQRGRVPVLDGFDTVRRLGGGAQAEVWLVRPADGGPELAAKCFTAPAPAATDHGGGVSGPARHNESEITQEWRILAQYDHEHLVRIHGVAELRGPGGWALLMDHAGGGSVQDIVASRGPLTVGECVTVLTPLGQVLSHLHGRGVVHGDVAPGNVLLTVHGKPVLGDLGLGRLVGQPPGRAAGTPGFFCPRDDGVSPASDVYAMAAVGWYALTGHAPAAARDRIPLAMYARGVPDELAAALEAGLAEDAAQRPTAAELAQAVFRSARAEPVALAQSVHPSVLPELLTRRDARRPARSVFAAPLRRLRRPGRPGLPLASLGAALALALAGAGFVGWRGVVGNGGGVGSPSVAADGRVATATATAATRLNVPSAAPGGTAGNAPAAAGEAASLVALGPQAASFPAEVRKGLLSPAPENALAALAWVRSYALSNADLGMLEAVNAVGSPAMAADVKVVRALAAAGHSYSGLETVVSGAAVASRELVPDGADAPYAAATVSATVATSPFAEQDAGGAVVYSQPAGQQQRLRIVLVQVRSRWMVQQILPGGG